MQINMEVIMTSWVAQVHKTYPQSLHNQKLPPRQDNQINAKLGKAINVIVMRVFKRYSTVPMMTNKRKCSVDYMGKQQFDILCLAM